MSNTGESSDITYVIGHKNPDTDSIVAAIGYAELKQQMGQDGVKAARAGKLNLQAEYILDRFNVPAPIFISDLVPKVKHYMSSDPVTINRHTPLWKALEILNSRNYKMLPIVDDDNTYLSSLHYNAFAENMLEKINPQKKGIITTSVNHLAETLNAQPIFLDQEDQLFKALIVVAAQDIHSFREHINPLPIHNLIILVGNRPDVQEFVIDQGVRCLIVTGRKTLDKNLKKKAEQKGVSILISPFDTSTTSWLALYSTPVETMGDDNIRPVRQEDSIRNIKSLFDETVSHTLTVVDDSNHVIGVLTQSDLMKEPNLKIIMVDHNELTQAVEGIDNFRILEIIDHHRLGNVYTSQPITFINRPVGSTSTIIASLFFDNKVALRKEIASILLAGILSDTLVLRSATTTEVDREIAEYLADITDLTIESFGKDIMNAASMVSKKPTDEILTMDQKRYDEDPWSFTVSQVEVMSPDEIMDRKDEVLQSLEKMNSKNGTLFAALMVTDIINLNSILFIAGDTHFINLIAYPKIDNNVYSMKGILSRKKQLIPLFTELLKKME
jgi:manganese-dependent inorganic pyrophosphatase